MSRPALKLARQQPKPSIPYSLLRRAVALFRSDMAPRSVRRHNARNWLIAMERLGDGHVLKGGSVRWGARQRSEGK